MELTRIEIESYKSIKEPVTISFLDELPTVLIGKNGCGKTNILEALSAIALANSNYYGSRETEIPTYRAYIQLSEDDVSSLLPDIVYDKSKCEIVAYSSGNNLKIDSIRSEYITSSIKKEIVDIRDLALQLKDAIELYEKQLVKISHDGYEELPICCYELRVSNGGLTNYNIIRDQADWFIKQINAKTEDMLKKVDDDEGSIVFITDNYWCRNFCKDILFRQNI